MMIIKDGNDVVNDIHATQKYHDEEIYIWPLHMLCMSLLILIVSLMKLFVS